MPKRQSNESVDHLATRLGAARINPAPPELAECCLPHAARPAIQPSEHITMQRLSLIGLSSAAAFAAALWFFAAPEKEAAAAVALRDALDQTSQVPAVKFVRAIDVDGDNQPDEEMVFVAHKDLGWRSESGDYIEIYNERDNQKVMIDADGNARVFRVRDPAMTKEFLSRADLQEKLEALQQRAAAGDSDIVDEIITTNGKHKVRRLKATGADGEIFVVTLDPTQNRLLETETEIIGENERRTRVRVNFDYPDADEVGPETFEFETADGKVHVRKMLRNIEVNVVTNGDAPHTMQWIGEGEPGEGEAEFEQIVVRGHNALADGADGKTFTLLLDGQPADQQETMQTLTDLRALGNYIQKYAEQYNDLLPPDLAALHDLADFDAVLLGTEDAPRALRFLPNDPDAEFLSNLPDDAILIETTTSDGTLVQLRADLAVMAVKTKELEFDSADEPDRP